ncbi:hypothetical protein BC829DRAFT_482371 [Chytridium lagenaria]|nr:hypothetical protein BC829DRAFT_482371 [Chytridium lagenaria]
MSIISADESFSLSMHPADHIRETYTMQDILSDPLFAEIIGNAEFDAVEGVKHVMTVSGTKIEDAGEKIEELKGSIGVEEAMKEVNVAAVWGDEMGEKEAKDVWGEVQENITQHPQPNAIEPHNEPDSYSMSFVDPSTSDFPLSITDLSHLEPPPSLPNPQIPPHLAPSHQNKPISPRLHSTSLAPPPQPPPVPPPQPPPHP